jgi:ribonucleoside-diphosphate reductase alpha chain
MKQVEKNGDWYLMCPDECPGLNDTYGDEFEKLYWSYVEQKKYKRVVKAQDVWTKILDSQIETGVPYISYKDAVNKKCNQKNLGTIKSSNLCNEISLYSDDKEYSVCNLCSIALPKFVEYKDDGTPFFNFEKLKEVAEYTVHPMNKVIDHNYYPTPETKNSNMAHRPLGIGAQGLADVYFKMKLPFESKEAAQLNKEIFETIYYGTLRGSIELAKMDGKYSSFHGSPFSEGKFQFDLAAEFDGINLDDYLSGRWDWDGLRNDLKEYGARNSMLIALMPTASSAQIMGNTESFEPIDSCIFKRRVLSGEYMVVNKYLVNELEQLGLWNKEMKDLIIAHDGSIQNIPSIPNDIKRVYKTVWELSMKSVIEQCRDRGVFVDQMQSMNLFMGNPNYKKLTSMHFYAWKNNLKSGMYYLRSKNSASAGKFSIDASLEKQIREKQEAGQQLTQKEEQLICSIDNKEECMMCSS